jgi:hypothetical protein
VVWEYDGRLVCSITLSRNDDNMVMLVVVELSSLLTFTSLKITIPSPPLQYEISMVFYSLFPSNLYGQDCYLVDFKSYADKIWHHQLG